MPLPKKNAATYARHQLTKHVRVSTRNNSVRYLNYQVDKKWVRKTTGHNFEDRNLRLGHALPEDVQ
jgi:hypothetical protein